MFGLTSRYIDRRQKHASKRNWSNTPLCGTSPLRSPLVVTDSLVTCKTCRNLMKKRDSK